MGPGAAAMLEKAGRAELLRVGPSTNKMGINLIRVKMYLSSTTLGLLCTLIIIPPVMRGCLLLFCG